MPDLHEGKLQLFHSSLQKNGDISSQPSFADCYDLN